MYGDPTISNSEIVERGGGYIDSGGYRQICVNGKYVLAHRLIMEEKIGRKLTPYENVHHINGDKLDNSIENLEIWNTCQPQGQRIQDKIDWAITILLQYPEFWDGEIYGR